MLDALASADGVTWLSICVKALVYATTLLAAGSALAVLTLRPLNPDDRTRLCRLAGVMALAAAALSVLRLPIRASFLMGGTWAGAVEPMMLDMVLHSPLGTAIGLRLIGLTLICAICLRGRAAPGIAALGCLLVAASFAMRGHALDAPRLVLATLVTLHILGLAFWTGVFAPLHWRLARADTQATAALAHDFGRKATWIVTGLSAAGLITLALLTKGQFAALTSTYSQFFAIKLALFAGVLGFAAWNKLRLTPALQADTPRARHRLALSLRLETVLLLAILAVTATLSTISAP